MDWSVLANELSKNKISYQGVSIDTRTIEPGQIFICIKGKKLDGHEFAKLAVEKGAVLLITERFLNLGVPEIHVTDTTEALGTLAKSYRELFDIPMIALTGSCGKTGTKEMLASILKLMGETLYTQGNLNNRWGVPLTLLRLKPSHQYAVIELGISLPSEMEILASITQPTMSLITNIHPQHVAGLGSVEGISREKSIIFKYLKPHGIAVVNLNESFSKSWSSMIGSHTRVNFSTEKNSNSNIHSEKISVSPRGTSMNLLTPLGSIPIHIPLLGMHVHENALAASAMAYALGVPLEKIQEGLSQVKPIAGRLCPHDLGEGIYLIDDTYNASPAAVKSALDWLGSCPGKKIFVMSNMAELGEDNRAYHAKMGEWILENKIDLCFLYGHEEFLKPTLEVLKVLENFKDKIIFFNSKNLLIENLKKSLTPHAGVLISVLIKGSRGNQMETIVQELLKTADQESYVQGSCLC